MLLASLGDALGFSKEVGAFLAGVSLASLLRVRSLGSVMVKP
jgi:Kef-type K+ transport system membrane component KefB